MFSLDQIEAAYQHCRKITQAHYENFPVGSLLIPKNKRHHVYAVYAFARYADDIADDDYPAIKDFESREAWEMKIKEDEGQRLEKLELWHQLLQSCQEGKKIDHPIFIALQKSIEELNLSYSLFEDLLSAFKQDICVRRYQSFDQLLDYSARSANPIGRIILRIFSYQNQNLDLLSDAICTALQLANFWQDIAVDLHKNRIYIPIEILEQYRLSEEDLFKEIPQEKVTALLLDLGKKTQKLFEQGAALPFLVKGRLSYELKVTWLGGMTILNRACFNPKREGFKRPKIDFLDKFNILWKTLFSTFTQQKQAYNPFIKP